MEAIIRIGDKIISRDKLFTAVEEIFALRAAGYSQQEVADKLEVDRTLVSRLETLGEVRKGRRIAVIAFPVLNKDEITGVLQEEGIDFYLVLSEAERWNFVRERSGLDLFNKIIEILARVRSFDAVVIIGSDQRIKIIKAILNNEVIGIEIGESPLEEDKFVDAGQVRSVIRALQKGREDE